MPVTYEAQGAITKTSELKKGKSEIVNTTVISSDEGAGQLGYAYFSDGRVK